MTSRVFGLLLVISIGCVGAHAQTNSTDEQSRGSDLFHACQASVGIADAPNGRGLSNDDYEHSEFCRGYFMAFNDFNNIHRSTICIGGASVGTTIRVYVAYRDKNPKQMDGWMIEGALLALGESYPCPASKK